MEMMETFSVVREMFYLILTVTGVPVNVVAIVILSRGKCGLSICTTRYLLSMAVSDLLVIIFEVMLWRLNYYYFPTSFLDLTRVCSAALVLRHASFDCSVWFTVVFTFDRFVLICCQKLKIKYCTERTAAVVLATTCVPLCLKNVPFYFSREPDKIINSVPWGCSYKASYFTDPGWVGFDWFDKMLTPMVPFHLVLLFNILTVRYILVASRVRQALRGKATGENRPDPEVESRRKSVVLLFTISGCFIVLWTPVVINFFYRHIASKAPSDYNNAAYIFKHVAYMLRNLSCCTNTFIYGVTQSKFREELKHAAKYPVAKVIQLINKQNN
ncbi:probable G-protein coupled receptor 139 [Leucoraja erinacea]|uniref:probable G-protein coupled receptor 139 n=1 Tax=Leucoraja erinaceus TaxID=7782 RepID=UPI00245479BA|nr:probable G-protein coupled receptor 139 [Leucoraja erinacea]